MSKKTVVFTQNVALVRKAFGEKLYRKVCTDCGVRVRARTRGKRVCPVCGGKLRKTAAEESATDQHE